MTPEQRAAMEQALEALEGIRQYGLDTLSGRVDGPDDRAWQRAAVNEMTKRARLGITALTAALEQPAQKRPPNCGTGYCSCIECVMEPEQQEPVAWYDEEMDSAYTESELGDGNTDGLEPLYTRFQAREPLTKECDTCLNCHKGETGLHSFNADVCRQCCHYFDSKYEAAHGIKGGA